MNAKLDEEEQTFSIVLEYGGVIGRDAYLFQRLISKILGMTGNENDRELLSWLETDRRDQAGR